MGESQIQTPHPTADTGVGLTSRRRAGRSVPASPLQQTHPPGSDRATGVRPSLPAGPVIANRRYLRIKHALDRVLAAAAIVLLLPLLAVLAAVVRIDSSGPAIFRQRRIGQHGQPFTTYKFRTMRVDAPTYSLKVGDDDPRITRVGRLLRRTALDELPQLWNIVRGEMSWIGPRPEQPFLVEGYADWQRARLRVRPGLTGWWQVRRRSNEQMHEHTDLDIYYVEHLSPWLDLKIVLMTPWAIWRQS